MAEFLEIDDDWLAAAAGAMPRDESAENEAVDAWLSAWSREEMARVMAALVRGAGSAAERELKSRYAAWRMSERPRTLVPRRCVGQLRERAQAAGEARVEREAKARAERDAEQRKLREARLRLMLAAVDSHWVAAEKNVQRGVASGYEQAVRTLADLAEAHALTGRRAEFEQTLLAWIASHRSRSALLRRLREARLWDVDGAHR